MPITRAKATALLNQREMALYDDSRANAIRNLDQKALSTRISRAREARDRARDLVQRQKLSSRDRTGNKRGTSGLANQRSKDKVELTTDILRRFEAQLDKAADADAAPRASTKAGKKAPRKSASRRADRRDARKTTRKAARGAGRKAASGSATTAATKKSSAKKSAGSASKSTRPATRTAAKKTGAAKAGARRASPTTAGATRSGARKTATGKAVAAKAGASGGGANKTAKTSARKTAKKTAERKSATRKLTPKQALKRTRALLEAKQARDREPKPWETLGGHGPDAAGQPGFQSGTAARRALELHAGEARIPAIQGSISTRDRINQGKRDHRGGD